MSSDSFQPVEKRNQNKTKLGERGEIPKHGSRRCVENTRYGIYFETIGPSFWGHFLGIIFFLDMPYSSVQIPGTVWASHTYTGKYEKSTSDLMNEVLNSLFCLYI